MNVVEWFRAALAAAVVVLGVAAPAAADDETFGAPISPQLLTYRYAPQWFTPERMAQAVLAQIASDQRYYAATESTRRAMRDFRPVFPREAVENRVAEFVRLALTPRYEATIARAAAAVPTKVRVVTHASHERLSFANGAITVAYLPEGAPGYGTLFGSGFGGPQQLEDPAAMTDGARAVYLLPEVLGGEPITLPESLKRVGIPGPAHLSLDRVLTAPALAMAADQAERQWLPPDCTPFSDLRSTDVERTEAKTCIARRDRFNKGFRLVHHLTLEGAELVGTNGQLLLRARLDRLDIEGPHGDLLASIAPDALPTPVDPTRARAERDADRDAAAQERRAARAAKERDAESTRAGRLETMRARAAAADIVGLTLGMTLAEAEASIRGRMKVGWVLGPEAEADPTTPLGNPRRPFRQWRAFVREDGAEQIVLAGDPTRSDRVLAIVRLIALDSSTETDTLRAQLMEKYGDDPAQAPRDRLEIVWTGHYGVVPPTYESDAVPLEQKFAQRACAISLGVLRSGTLELLEVSAPSNPDQTREFATDTPLLTVIGGRLASSEGDSWEVDKWAACGPMVHAELGRRNAEKYLTVALLDLAAYADIYRAGLAETDAAKAAAPKPDL